MRGIFSELKKIWKNRLFLSMTIILFLVNIYFLFDAGKEKYYTTAQYNALWDELDAVQGGEKAAYLEERQDELRSVQEQTGVYPWGEYQLIRDVRSELLAANSYRTYVEELEKKKELLVGSVLFSDGDGYAVQSAKKASRDYGRVKPPVIREARSKGVLLAMLLVTDVLMVFAGVFACIVLFVREREQDMVRLQWTLRHGRQRHFFYKAAALFLSAAGLVFLFYGSNYLVAGLAYGFGPLGRDIRMVEPFATSLQGISVGGWLLLHFLGKVMILFVVLLLCSFFCTRIHNFTGIILGFAAVLLIEFAFYTRIPATSVFSPLRYVNLVAMLQMKDWFLGYSHVNVFGMPVSYLVCVVFLLCVAAVAGFAGSFRGYLCYGEKLEHRSGIRRRESKKSRRAMQNVWSWEVWKALWMQRLLPVVAGLLLLQGYLYGKAKLPIQSTEDAFYKSYMKRLEGPITEETPEILEEVRKKAESSRSSAALSAYQKVVERYEYLQEHGGYFVYDSSYRILIGGEKQTHDAILVIKMMAAILLLTSAIVSYDPEHRMMVLLHSTVYGEKRVAEKKVILCCIFGVLACAGVVLPDVWMVWRRYGLPGLSYPACSLPSLAGYGRAVSIGGYLVLLFLVRAVMCMLVVPFILFAAEKWKSFVYTFLGCAVVLLCLPLLTLLYPERLLLAYPLYGVYGNVLLQGGLLRVIVYVGFIGIAGILCREGRKKLWS